MWSNGVLRSMSRSGGVPAQGHDGEHSAIEVVAGWALWRRYCVVAKVRARMRGRIRRECLSDIVAGRKQCGMCSGGCFGYLFGLGTGSALMTRAELASEVSCFSELWSRTYACYLLLVITAHPFKAGLSLRVSVVT